VLAPTELPGAEGAAAGSRCSTRDGALHARRHNAVERASPAKRIGSRSIIPRFARSRRRAERASTSPLHARRCAYPRLGMTGGTVTTIRVLRTTYWVDGHIATISEAHRWMDGTSKAK
jgi:hypothetical protein